MKSFNRIFLVVLDSVGIGEAPDAKKYGDAGADTLGHIADKMNGLNLPNLKALGLGNIRREPIKGVEKVEAPLAHHAKMQETSAGKDTMTGHWELMGLQIGTPFQTFPEGFPDELLTELENRTGRGILGNKPASGTAIIEELGEEHMRTGKIIIYTSADSVLQIAAHEEIVPLEELYRICEIARELTLDERFMVGRVIARPFVGEPEAFERTSNRHDYALKPFGKTVMNNLQDAGLDVIALGKIKDIYDGEGVTESLRTVSNEDGMNKLVSTMQRDFKGLAFLNLVDFDALFGHRRDPAGYGEALEALDRRIPEFLELLREDDLFIFTADHGNDPIHHGTDHTREYVPLIAYHKQIEQGKHLGIRETFADAGATIVDNFGAEKPKHGTSFLNDILPK